MHRLLPITLVGLGISAFACGSAPEPTVSDGSVRQRTLEVRVGTGPNLLVLAVDDGPSVAPVELREAFVTKTLRPMLRRLARLEGEKRASEWWPRDVTVIVVHPSQPTHLARAVHRLHVVDVDDAAFEGWTNEIATDVRDGVAAPGDRYAPIERAVDAERAVTHWRLPADDEEAKVIGTLPDFSHESFVWITSRDDDSTDPPAAFAAPRNTWWNIDVLRDCGEQPLPRFAEIDRAGRARLTLGTLECPKPLDRGEPLAWWSERSPQGLCPFWNGPSVARDADGRAQCRLTFTAPNATCAPTRGWSDPRGPDGDRVPTWDEYGNRVCEVRLLTGAAADGCIRGTQAIDAGWCIERGSVSTGTAACDPFAFTRNALPDDLLATLHLTCDMTR